MVKKAYVCEICNGSYKTEEEAKTCEERGVEFNDFKRGDLFRKIPDMRERQDLGLKTCEVVIDVEKGSHHESAYRVYSFMLIEHRGFYMDGAHPCKGSHLSELERVEGEEKQNIRISLQKIAQKEHHISYIEEVINLLE